MSLARLLTGSGCSVVEIILAVVGDNGWLSPVLPP